jgi:hypothetical protein
VKAQLGAGAGVKQVAVDGAQLAAREPGEGWQEDGAGGGQEDLLVGGSKRRAGGGFQEVGGASYVFFIGDIIFEVESDVARSSVIDLHGASGKTRQSRHKE